MGEEREEKKEYEEERINVLSPNLQEDSHCFSQNRASDVCNRLDGGLSAVVCGLWSAVGSLWSMV